MKLTTTFSAFIPLYDVSAVFLEYHRLAIVKKLERFTQNDPHTTVASGQESYTFYSRDDRSEGSASTCPAAFDRRATFPRVALAGCRRMGATVAFRDRFAFRTEVEVDGCFGCISSP